MNCCRKNSGCSVEISTAQKADVKGKLIEYMWYMKKQGYAEDTIKKRAALLRRLVTLGANLWDPETIKEVVATQESWSPGYKVYARYSYQSFIDMEGLTWTPPKYRKPDSVPFIPLESELDLLINGTGKKVSMFLQGLKETGVDPGELSAVEWTDVNEEAGTIAINHPVKGHNARILRISKDLIARLNCFPTLTPESSL